MENSESEECRVCRCPAEESRPLYKPCLCNGSIALVHQDCLEAWLKHSSQKDRCELCATVYEFEPEYSPDAPKVIPFPLVFKSFLKIVSLNYVPRILRIGLSLVLWFCVVPIWTAAYTRFMRDDSIAGLSQRYRDWRNIRADCVSGLVMIGTIILLVIILVS